MITERRAFDLNNYFDSSGNIVPNAKEKLIVDFTSGILEQGRRPFYERTNIYTLKVDSDGDLYDPLFGKLKDCLLDNSNTYRLEKYALLNHLQPWANNPSSQFALWISPPSGEIGYDESRFILSIPDKDKKQITNIAICGPQRGEDCLGIANNLRAYTLKHFDIKTLDALRATPLFINIPRGENYFDFFARFIKIPLVWETLKQGQATSGIQWAESIAQQVVDTHLNKLITSQTDRERISLGASMESYSANLGAEIQFSGSCGLSNSALLARHGAYNAVFYGSKIGERECVWCPICEATVKVEVFPDSIRCTKCHNYGPNKLQEAA